jgi:octaprenyl-diphosphate synthase
MGKMPGKDLEEGKLTLPLIIALKKSSPEEKQRMNDIINAGVIQENDFDWVKTLLSAHGGIEETLDRSREYLEKSKQHLGNFPDSEEKQALLKLTDRILTRTY